MRDSKKHFRMLLDNSFERERSLLFVLFLRHFFVFLQSIEFIHPLTENNNAELVKSCFKCESNKNVKTYRIF